MTTLSSAFPTDSGVRGWITAGRTRSRDTRQIPSALTHERGQIAGRLRRVRPEADEAHRSFPFRAPFYDMKGAGKCRDETTRTTRYSISRSAL
jgi:hypothetical protein